MNYYLDTEFDGFNGDLLSLALVSEDGYPLYLIFNDTVVNDPWVIDNVVPILHSVPAEVATQVCFKSEAPYFIQRFLEGDPCPHIITDWPDDVRHFCSAIITGPGSMVGIPHITFEIARVDAYPTFLEGAVQHNAWWDAMALRLLITGKNNFT